MNVLILSCNNGAGHNVAAQALRECFYAHGDSCEIRDGLSFLSPLGSKAVSEVHTLTYCYAPGIFDRSWRQSLNNPELFNDRSAAKKVLEHARFSLGKAIMAGGYDLVLCTHVFPAIMLSAARRQYGLPVRTGFVETDYGYTPGSAESGMDYYFLPSDEAAARLDAAGVQRERMVFSGIPVPKIMYVSTEKAEAKRALSLNPSRPHLLLMSGSMGNGPIPELLSLLVRTLDQATQITVVCGNNKRLWKKLNRSYGRCNNIHILSYETDVSLLLDSADLLLSKPGGLCTTEASVKGLPMVLFQAAGGCERSNLDFFRDAGGAKTGDTPEELCAICSKLLADPQALSIMSRALKALFPWNAAERICETFWDRSA